MTEHTISQDTMDAHIAARRARQVEVIIAGRTLTVVVLDDTLYQRTSNGDYQPASTELVTKLARLNQGHATINRAQSQHAPS